jgi:hypothetical protein
MLPQDKLDLILRRHDEISAKLSAGASGQEFVALSRELADLDTLVDAIRAWREGCRELEDVDAMLADAGTDADMRAKAYVQGGLMAAQAGIPGAQDMWSGYPQARRRLLKAMADAGADPIVIAGDSHNVFEFGERHRFKL